MFCGCLSVWPMSSIKRSRPVNHQFYSCSSPQPPPPPPHHRLWGRCRGVACQSQVPYCVWYSVDTLWVWSCYCLGCKEVIRWHFNRQSAFFAVALGLICGIRTQPDRHWTCCLVEGELVSVGNAVLQAGTVLIRDKPRWQSQSSVERSGLLKWRILAQHGPL